MKSKFLQSSDLHANEDGKSQDSLVLTRKEKFSSAKKVKDIMFLMLKFFLKPFTILVQ